MQIEELTRVKTIVKTNEYNYKKEAFKILKNQLEFIAKFFSEDVNIYQYDDILDRIDDIYVQTKKIIRETK